MSTRHNNFIKKIKIIDKKEQLEIQEFMESSEKANDEELYAELERKFNELFGNVDESS